MHIAWTDITGTAATVLWLLIDQWYVRPASEHLDNPAVAHTWYARYRNVIKISVVLAGLSVIVLGRISQARQDHGQPREKTLLSLSEESVRVTALLELQRRLDRAPEDRWDIYVVILSFIRERTPVTPAGSSVPPPSRSDDLRLALKILRESDLNIDRPSNFVIDLQGLDLRHAELMGAQFQGALLSDAILDSACLAGIHLEHATLRDTKLRYAGLAGAHLCSADLEGATLNYADCVGIDLSHAKLEGASLQGTRFPTLTGLDGINLRRHCLRPDLLYLAGLTATDLLTPARLCSTTVIGADASDAVFDGANLTGANFTNTKLSGASFTNTNTAYVTGLRLVVTPMEGSKHPATDTQ